jgi:hypothetical protein
VHCSLCIWDIIRRSAWRMRLCSSSHGHIGMIASMLRQSLQWQLPCRAHLKRCRSTTHCSTASSPRTQHEGIRDATELRYSPNWLLQRPRPQVTAGRSIYLSMHTALMACNQRHGTSPYCLTVRCAGHTHLVASFEIRELQCHQGRFAASHRGQQDAEI